ncbi:MAG TPA: hypothetical protein VHE34_27945 [Puia sp.]|uniref:hypothetical protein n=1 Tax=Puia sp. TaxID=2045100 RepID=UPI002C6C1DD7|nr:hypothetical protein [Puia sp.]HVU99099.1 hypothetical protein [Puia sp.]
MKKTILFSSVLCALITMVLASTSCTKKVTAPPAPAEEDLTVVIGSVNAKGDTTIYLQTVVKPH